MICPLYISHRMNEIPFEPSTDGIEFDIRDSAGEIIVTHDPYSKGCTFRAYVDFLRQLPGCSDKLYIVNVKSEGIELDAIHIMETAGLRNFFLLDCSFPRIKALAFNHNESRLAIRVSEYEGTDTAIKISGRVGWIWLDVFTCLPICREDVEMLRSHGYKICLVSPELQGQPDRIEEYAAQMVAEGWIPDAICGKNWNRVRWFNALRLQGELSPSQN